MTESHDKAAAWGASKTSVFANILACSEMVRSSGEACATSTVEDCDRATESSSAATTCKRTSFCAASCDICKSDPFWKIMPWPSAWIACSTSSALVSERRNGSGCTLLLCRARTVMRSLAEVGAAAAISKDLRRNGPYDCNNGAFRHLLAHGSSVPAFFLMNEAFPPTGTTTSAAQTTRGCSDGIMLAPPREKRPSMSGNILGLFSLGLGGDV
mmetsp:Transcript_144608/g.376350  ORF Transcript_144608/g.376350 Transcript_144608/m.376350 type:complete len:213 (-) Transcript_144608:351-989(-)